MVFKTGVFLGRGFVDVLVRLLPVGPGAACPRRMESIWSHLKDSLVQPSPKVPGLPGAPQGGIIESAASVARNLLLVI